MKKIMLFIMLILVFYVTSCKSEDELVEINLMKANQLYQEKNNVDICAEYDVIFIGVFDGLYVYLGHKPHEEDLMLTSHNVYYHYICESCTNYVILAYKKGISGPNPSRALKEGLIGEEAALEIVDVLRTHFLEVDCDSFTNDKVW